MQTKQVRCLLLLVRRFALGFGLDLMCSRSPNGRRRGTTPRDKFRSLGSLVQSGTAVDQSPSLAPLLVLRVGWRAWVTTAEGGSVAECLSLSCASSRGVLLWL